MRHTTRMLRRIERPLLLAATFAAMTGAARAQEFSSSVVGTSFDFITDSDPSSFLCLESKGHGPREMPDKTGAGPLVQPAFIFVAYFEDGTSLDMAIDDAFETADRAREEAMRYVPRLGKLPTVLRRGVARMVVHRGGEDTTAFSDVGLIVVYSDNATKRISTHDLEETIFHESVHASWDRQHAKSPEWRAAQSSDDRFVTRYARKHPAGEDLAESTLFAYTLLHHTERIPPEDAERIRSEIPARIAFVKDLIPPGEPIFTSIGPRYACDGSGRTFTVDPVEPDEDAGAPEPGAAGDCHVNIRRAGKMSDILSNALVRGLGQTESVVRAFLAGADERFASGDDLLAAAVTEFGIDRVTLEAEVQRFLHCNCGHPR